VESKNRHSSGKLRILVLVLFAVFASGTDRAEARLDVRLNPQTEQIAVAETCTLEVYVATTMDDSLACLECVVAFDSTLLSLVDVEEGSLFADSGHPTFFDPDILAPDTVKVVDCLLGYRTFFLPPGDLVRFVFRGDKPGVAAVRIVDIAIWDLDRVVAEPLPLVVDPNAWITIGNPTGTKTAPTPSRTIVSYPNPFNPRTTIELALPASERGEVTLSVYTPAGGEVKMLFAGELRDGFGEFEWDGRDDRGRPVASGVYFAVARTSSATYTTKLVLIE
jgi:hypothetical protein